MSKSSTLKLVESSINKEEFYVRVRHFHKGNSSKNARHGKEFVTEATIFAKGSDDIVGMGKAYCSKGDNPRREVGRQVAIGRALRDAKEFDSLFLTEGK